MIVYVSINIPEENQVNALQNKLDEALKDFIWKIDDVLVPKTIKEENNKLREEIRVLRHQVTELLKSQGKTWYLEQETNMPRDYKDEYKKFQSSTESKKDRAHRNKARRAAARKGRVRKGDGKDIDHRDGNPRNNSPKNLRVVSKSTNRAKR